MNTAKVASETPVVAACGPPAIVALTASAGGLKALSEIVAKLPAEFPVPVLILQHVAPHYASHLAEILTRRSALPVREAREGDRLLPGVVYVAPPDRHLVVGPDQTLHMSMAAPVHFVRPAADMLFASLAVHYGSRAIVVVLTGMGSDGAIGTKAVKAHGGIVIVQSTESAEFSGMPSAALRAGPVDCVLPLEKIADMLVQLVKG